MASENRIKKGNDPYRLSGTVFAGKYELIEYAGGGGMGAVYLANDPAGQTVAIKILKPDIVIRHPDLLPR